MSAFRPGQVTTYGAPTASMTEMINAIMPIILIVMLFKMMGPMIAPAPAK